MTMSSAELWQSILDEARGAAARDPAYGAMLANAILDQPGFERALIRQIAGRLGRPSGTALEFGAACAEAFAADPAIVRAAGTDLESIVRNDPASPGYLPVLLDFKGY